jgi:hypothetical protein
MGFEILALVLMVGFVGAVHAWDRVHLRYASALWLSQRTRLAERRRWTADTARRRVEGTLANGCSLTITVRADAGDLRADWRVHLDTLAGLSQIARGTLESLDVTFGHFPSELRGIISPDVREIGDPALDGRAIVRSPWSIAQVKFFADDHRVRLIEALGTAKSQITLEEGVLQLSEFARESIAAERILETLSSLCDAVVQILNQLDNSADPAMHPDAIALLDSSPLLRREARRHTRLTQTSVLLADDESALLDELRAWARSQDARTLLAVCAKVDTASPAPAIVLQALSGKDPAAFQQALGRVLLRAQERDGVRLAEFAGRDPERLAIWLQTLVRLPPCPASQAFLVSLPQVTEPRVIEVLVLLAVQGCNEYARLAAQRLHAVGDRRHVGALLQKSEQWSTPPDLREALRFAVGAMVGRGQE